MGSKARRESDLRSLSDLYLSHLLSRIRSFLKRNRTKTKSDCRVLSARFSIFDQDCYSSISLFQRIKKSQPKPQDCFSIFEVSRLAQTYQRYVKEETSVAERTCYFLFLNCPYFTKRGRTGRRRKTILQMYRIDTRYFEYVLAHIQIFLLLR